MILRENHPSHMIFMDVSSIRLGLQAATLSEGLVPDLILEGGRGARVRPLQVESGRARRPRISRNILDTK